MQRRVITSVMMSRTSLQRQRMVLLLLLQPVDRRDAVELAYHFMSNLFFSLVSHLLQQVREVVKCFVGILACVHFEEKKNERKIKTKITMVVVCVFLQMSIHIQQANSISKILPPSEKKKTQIAKKIMRPHVALCFFKAQTPKQRKK